MGGQDDEPARGNADNVLAAVDAAISSARHTVEHTNVVLEESRKVLQGTRELTAPSTRPASKPEAASPPSDGAFNPSR